MREGILTPRASPMLVLLYGFVRRIFSNANTGLHFFIAALSLDKRRGSPTCRDLSFRVLGLLCENNLGVFSVFDQCTRECTSVQQGLCCTSPAQS